MPCSNTCCRCPRTADPSYTQFSVGQLKILQEVITLTVFLPFSVYFLRQPLRLDYLWAALCVLGAVYFVFRGGSVAH